MADKVLSYTATQIDQGIAEALKLKTEINNLTDNIIPYKNSSDVLSDSCITEGEETISITKRLIAERGIDTIPATIGLGAACFLKAFGEVQINTSTLTGKSFEIVSQEIDTIGSSLPVANMVLAEEKVTGQSDDSGTVNSPSILLNVVPEYNQNINAFYIKTTGDISNFRFKLKSTVTNEYFYYYPDKYYFDKGVGKNLTGANTHKIDLLSDIDFEVAPTVYRAGLPIDIELYWEGSGTLRGSTDGLPWFEVDRQVIEYKDMALVEYVDSLPSTAGIYTLPTIQDNGNGSVTLSNCEVCFYADITGSNPVRKYSVTGDSFNLTNSVLNYIVCDFNSGTPILKNLLSKETIHQYNGIVPIYTIFRDGVDLEILNWDHTAKGLSNKICDRLVRTERISRESGLSIAEKTGKYIILTEGYVWYGVTRNYIEPIDTQTNDIVIFKHVSGSWEKQVQNTYNNTQYDDGTNLVTLSTGNYAVNWVYRCVSGGCNKLYIVLGNGDYSLLQAQSSIEPSNLPPLITSSTILVGRIIVKKNDDTATQIESAFYKNINYIRATDHNLTTSVQGGTSTERYHLSQAQYNKIDIALANRKTVGTTGDFQTLNAAVTWFNTYATSDTELLIDAGEHDIADTITVSNTSYGLQIRGLGSAVTNLNAAYGLAGKPMFDIRSRCDMNKLTMTGSTLDGYGVNTNEDGIVFSTNTGLHSEITDINMGTFNHCIIDTVGTDLFVFNFIFRNFKTSGIEINTENTGSWFDVETGTFIPLVDNTLAESISLTKASNGNFIINTILFEQSASGQKCIKYTPGTGNYIPNGICQIMNCSYNNQGIFTDGFDFTRADGRDANIYISNNIGIESKRPHARISVLNNSTVTTITTPGTFYKAAFTNTSSYKCKVIVADNRFTYQPNDVSDCKITLTCNVISASINRNIDIAIVKNGNTVLGLFGQMTVRVSTASETFPVSTVTYLEGIKKDDYLELWVTNSGSGDVVVQDLNMLIETVS